MISVIIPAYNEEKMIGGMLESLAKQETSEIFEVIVVDNNSIDKTTDIAKQYLNKLDLKIVIQKRKGRGAARKMGFEFAKGDILFSTDADCVLPSLWIETLTKELKSSNAVAVTSLIEITDSNKFINFMFNHVYKYLINSYKLIFGHYWLGGFSFAVYKNIYDKSGGFNEQLNTEEDSDLAIRISKLGKIELVTNISVNFAGRRFNQSLGIGFFQYAKSFINFYILKKRNIELPDVR